MLALKLVLRGAGEVATYVFDEVDAGIGGVTADAVGQQIRTVADHRQVLCVTHLPQIAAFADVHFHVAKSDVDGHTETEVRLLDAGARKQEMARMLGGADVSESALSHANEMLQRVKKRKSRSRRAR
jgi:DNA repair protein RecN (Recombination protein N)